jgi:hypothetical protein
LDSCDSGSDTGIDDDVVLHLASPFQKFVGRAFYLPAANGSLFRMSRASHFSLNSNEKIFFDFTLFLGLSRRIYFIFPEKMSTVIEKLKKKRASVAICYYGVRKKTLRVIYCCVAGHACRPGAEQDRNADMAAIVRSADLPNDPVNRIAHCQCILVCTRDVEVGEELLWNYPIQHHITYLKMDNTYDSQKKSKKWIVKKNTNISKRNKMCYFKDYLDCLKNGSFRAGRQYTCGQHKTEDFRRLLEIPSKRKKASTHVSGSSKANSSVTRTRSHQEVQLAIRLSNFTGKESWIGQDKGLLRF